MSHYHTYWYEAELSWYCYILRMRLQTFGENMFSEEVHTVMMEGEAIEEEDEHSTQVE